MVCNSKSPKAKEPSKYICNTATNRWVLKSGKIGQTLTAKSPVKTRSPVNVKSPINSHKRYATLHVVDFPKSVIVDDVSSIVKMNKIIKEYSKPNWKHGDVIVNFTDPDYGENNAGKFMWDNNNKKLVKLDTSWDDYGHVPKLFLVGKEFNNATYWTNAIEHNEGVYAKFDKKLVKNLKKGDGLVTFDYKGEPWCCVFKSEKYNLYNSQIWCYLDGTDADYVKYVYNRLNIPNHIPPEHVLIKPEVLFNL